MKLAPIALFVYNRPEHTRKTVESLAANNLAGKSDLIVFSDGAKNAGAKPKVGQVREYIDGIAGFASVRVIKRDKNLGLANSVITGVTEVVNEYGKIIVLEDDMITSRFFLEYMNDGLELYSDNEEVATIQAHIFPWSKPPLPDSYFLPSQGCWGWGTWKRAWDNFNLDAVSLLKQIKDGKKSSKFDMDSSYPYTKLLESQVAGKVDSWAVRWYANNFLLGVKGLYPGRTFVHNIGFDGSGKHCGEISSDILTAEMPETYKKLEKIPVEIDPVIFGYVKAYHKRMFPQRGFIFRMLRMVVPRKILNFIRRVRQRGLQKVSTGGR